MISCPALRMGSCPQSQAEQLRCRLLKHVLAQQAQQAHELQHQQSQGALEAAQQAVEALQMRLTALEEENEQVCNGGELKLQLHSRSCSTSRASTA